MGTWATQRLEPAEGESVGQGVAHEDFKAWASGSDVDVRTVTSAALGKRLSELGYDRKKRNVGQVLVGVRLRDEEAV